MSKHQAPSTNQGAGLNIPRLGALPDGGSIDNIVGTQPAIVQDGEDAEAVQMAQANKAMIAGAQPGPATPLHSPETLAALQVTMDRAAARAHNNAMSPRYFEKNELGENQKLQPLGMPARGSLESMQRPDLDVQPVSEALFKDLAEELAFLEEFVIVNIHPTSEQGTENPVMLSVNGRPVYVWRGHDTVIRRKYLEQLMRAQPVQIQTEQARAPNGEVRNLIHRNRALKYPFNLVRDDNPRGRPWVRKIMAEK